MGQFGNQPDFGTRAIEAPIDDDITNIDNNLNKAALYISDAPAATCNITVMMPNRLGVSEAITFRNVARGTFMPICVDNVLATGTTATRVIAYW